MKSLLSLLKPKTTGLLAKNKLGSKENFENREAFLHRIETTYQPQTATRCAACNSEDFKPFDAQRAFRPQEALFLEFSHLKQDLFICKCCGLIQVRTILPADFYYEYINTYYNQPTIPQTPEALKHMENVHYFKHAFTADYMGQKKREKILEISSYMGLGLAELSKTHDCYGVEPEYNAALFSVSQYPQLQNRIINDVVENCSDALLPLAPFDTILLSCCFRQISHPTEVLETLSKIITPGGLLIITEVVLSDYIFLESPQNVAKHFSHNKACYYNTKNLTYLLNRFGFSFETTLFQGQGPDKPCDLSAIVFRFDGKRHDNSELLERSSKLTGTILDYFEQFAASAS